MRVLGIDPGLQRTGFGVIEVQGAQLAYVASGTISTTEADRGNLPARLKLIFSGVDEVIVCSPPHDGKVSDLILAAAHVAKVDRLFQIGGAQAIAAMAYGTESVPHVDKIYGPGNIFVVLAKQRLYGVAAIDALPGVIESAVIEIQNLKSETLTITVEAGDASVANRAGLGDWAVTIPASTTYLISALDSSRFVRTGGKVRIQIQAASGDPSGRIVAYRLP